MGYSPPPPPKPFPSPPPRPTKPGVCQYCGNEDQPGEYGSCQGCGVSKAKFILEPSPSDDGELIY